MKWRYQKKSKEMKRHKIQIISCFFSKTIRKGTWFENANISIETACTFIGYFITMYPPRQKFLGTELEMSASTVVNWFNLIRKDFLPWSIQISKPIGGPNCIVEIDEEKFGKRKYRGRIIDGQWHFGGFERPSNELFISLMDIPDRSTDTLLNAIQTNILPGTTTISDCWKAYNCLNIKRFQHLTVNYSYNFVDPNIRKYPNHTQRFHKIFEVIAHDNELNQNV